MPDEASAPQKTINAADVSPEAALATIRVSEQILANHRHEHYEAIKAKAASLDLAGLVATIEPLVPMLTREGDIGYFVNAMRVIADFQRVVTDAAARNVQLAVGNKS